MDSSENSQNQNAQPPVPQAPSAHAVPAAAPLASAAVPAPLRNNLFVRIIAVLLIVGISYGAGYAAGHRGFIFIPKEFKVVNQANQPQVVDYNLLWDAVSTLNSKYIDKPVDQQKVLYGAIQGAVSSVGDPYTTFFEPQELKDFQTNLSGKFFGIGAEIGQKNGVITIVAPIDGSPAQKAGLQAKDVVAAVNGQSTAEWSVDQAVAKIRGDKGTKVTLTIIRQGKDKPFDVPIVRDEIKVKSVKWDYKDVNGKKIAVVTLSQFGDDTKPLFDQAVNDILTKNVNGIVIDLRNNPGGYLQTAVDVASNWLAPGDLVVTEAKSEGDPTKYNAEGQAKLKGVKTVVLINGGSASAAEILSGALHDHQAAELIGEKSFGKGSVQELVSLKDGSALKITVAKWITPGGKNLNHDGLEPDVKVTLTQENVDKGQDPQMDKALEEVTK